MHYKFVKIFLLLFVGCLSAPLLFNLLVDPFKIYNAPSIKGFNHEKVEYNSQLRMSKAIEIANEKPKSLIFGSSRTKWGIRPLDAEKQSGQNFLNSSFDGASFDEIYAYFLHALNVQPELKTVIIGIDMFAFGKYRQYQKDFSENRLQQNGYTFKDLQETLLTWKGLFASLNTVKANLTALPQTFSNEILEKGELNYLKGMKKFQEGYHDYEISTSKIEKFKNLTKLCQENGVTLKVFICPVNAMYWEFYYQNDLWPAVEQLKRELSAIHPIWDFSGYTPLTTETLLSEEPLYLECSHFNPCAGRILLKQMFSGPENSSVGCLLTEQSIDNHLIKILKDREVWIHGPGKEIDVKFTNNKD